MEVKKGFRKKEIVKALQKEDLKENRVLGYRVEKEQGLEYRVEENEGSEYRVE